MYKDLKILPIVMELDQRPVKPNVNGKRKMKSFVETERKILCKHWGFQAFLLQRNNRSLLGLRIYSNKQIHRTHMQALKRALQLASSTPSSVLR